MLAELLQAPSVIDDGEGGVRLTPEVDVLAIIRDDVAVPRAIWRAEAAIVELEPITTASGAVDDLDFMAIEVAVTKHGTHLSVGGLLKPVDDIGRYQSYINIIYA